MASAETSMENGADGAYIETTQEPGSGHPNPSLLPLANYLEHIVVLLTQANDAHDSDLLRGVLNRYFSSRLQVAIVEPNVHILDTTTRNVDAQRMRPLSTTREMYAQHILAFLQASPHFRVEGFNTTALVDEQNGTANVFSMNRVTGYDNENRDLTRESVLSYHFERDARGEWICVRLDIIRGPGHFWVP